MGAFAVGLNHYLIISAILFGLGLLTVVSRRNAIGILMGVELMLNAANINFVAFSHYITGAIGGMAFTVFVILLAATEAAIALALIIAIYRKFKTIEVDRVNTMKE